MTLNKNLCYFLQCLCFSFCILDLLTFNYFRVFWKKIFRLHYLFFFGIRSIDFSQSFLEILSSILLKELELKVWKIKLGLIFSINRNNNPFEELIGKRFSIFNLNFLYFFYVKLFRNWNPFFPEGNVPFFIGLYFVLSQFDCVGVETVLIIVDIFFELGWFFTERIDPLWALKLRLIELGEDSGNSLWKLGDLGDLLLDQLDILSADGFGKSILVRLTERKLRGLKGRSNLNLLKFNVLHGKV